MRQLRKNKQKLYYALADGDQVPVYKYDDEGNLIYQEVDGESVPKDTGVWETPYKDPVVFYGNINTGNVGYTVARAYGISSGNFDAVLCMRKGEIPLEVTSLIWYDREPTYRTDGKVDPKSANYSVRRIPPCLDEICYLLRKVDSNAQDED
ncbi:MAG: hypothetical protein IJ680_05825 [Paludibacteraceae bacterium]|nr:hypothetical protein [Paludibacteraceae bacterium]